MIVPHRKYFQEHESFEPIANITDEDIIKTVHWNFRLLYLRDYALGHYLDERILQIISAVRYRIDLFSILKDNTIKLY